MISTMIAAMAMGAAPTQPENQYARRLNAFGERLWSAMDLGQGNQAIAPLSVGVCLSMLIDGANEPTRSQLEKTLGMQGFDAAEGARDLSDSLKEAKGNPFEMANGVWLRGNSRLNANYKDSIEKNFGGEIRRFGSAGPSTLKEINGWVKDHTKGRIPTIFDHLDSHTSVVLVNALTFDGKWKTPFKKEETRDDDFTIGSGEKKNVPMMHQSGHFDVWSGAGYSEMTLPYEGDRFSMTFLLPSQSVKPGDVLSKWLKRRDAAYFGMPSQTSATKISIPKFKIECSYNLKPALGKLGLSPLYEDAKFGKIAPDLNQLTKIDQIQHKTYIKVDEEGTQAAATTGVAVVTRAILMKPITFDLDRPFAYAIVDRETGVVVMMGIVNDPRN